jgi:hypothetical protein
MLRGQLPHLSLPANAVRGVDGQTVAPGEQLHRTNANSCSTDPPSSTAQTAQKLRGQGYRRRGQATRAQVVCRFVRVAGRPVAGANLVAKTGRPGHTPATAPIAHPPPGGPGE